MSKSSQGGLLRDIRVLEFGQFVAAPFCGRVLGDLGADVIKVETPGAGDPVRGWGAQVNGRGLWWSVHGRNQRSITLNLKHPEARRIVLELAAKCDVVLENYRPGQMEKFGLGPDAFAGAKPGIAVVRISGYGQTGPEANQAGWGVIGEAQGGLRYLCAHPPEISDLPSVRVGISIGDSIAGLYGVIGALAAVLEQRANGARKEACVIDVALGEAILSLMEGSLPEFGYSGKIRQPTGSRIPTAAPSNAYRTKEDWVLIAANSNPLFKALTEVIGRPELAADPRFVSNNSRVANVQELDSVIESWTMSLPTGEVIAKLTAAQIPATKIYTTADVAADVQYRARDMVHEVEDPGFGGPILHPGVVPLMLGSDRKAQVRWAGPDVGAHNDEVYGELLGYSAAEIANMKQRGVI